MADTQQDARRDTATPGPWRSVTPQGIAAPAWEIIGPNNEAIASGPRWGSEHGLENLMNGELLARAPTLQADNERLRNALEQIANGEGTYGAQAHEYKMIARAALTTEKR